MPVVVAQNDHGPSGVESSSSSTQKKSWVNTSKRMRLQDMKVFVLDNSLRESTVGQSVGHSIQDKFEVLDATTKCGFNHCIVGAFGVSRRVDDLFASQLQEKMHQEEQPASFYAFSEVYAKIDEVSKTMISSNDCIPIGLLKMQEYSIPHAIIEIDLAINSVDWEVNFPVSKLVEHLTFLLKWCDGNLALPPDGSKRRNHFINLRDFPVAMLTCPDRVLDLVKAIAEIPAPYRPAGLLHEEPIGEYFADEVAMWNQAVRETMDENGWPSLFQVDGETLDGLLLHHAHRQWGLADAVVLDVLASGADGIWCSIAEEGAAMGHACSCVTLGNLARLGNQDILTRYNTRYLAEAARIVTKTTTNKNVSERQIVYGPRAIEAVFGFTGIAGGGVDKSIDLNGDGAVDELDHFSLAKFLGVDDPPIRISTLSSPALVVKRLKQCFGDDNAFTEEIASKMLKCMITELSNNIEMEHTSPMGIALLWQNVTGTLTPTMQDAIDNLGAKSEAKSHILKAAEECFNDYLVDGKEELDYSIFYEAYLRPFFGCFTCERTRFVLDAIDLNDDGGLAWKEWRFWCLWALRQYPDQIASVEDLHSVVLRNAILPLSVCPIAQERQEAYSQQ